MQKNKAEMHFFRKKFAYIKKKQYFCSRFRPKSNFMPLPAEASFPD